MEMAQYQLHSVMGIAVTQDARGLLELKRGLLHRTRDVYKTGIKLYSSLFTRADTLDAEHRSSAILTNAATVGKYVGETLETYSEFYDGPEAQHVRIAGGILRRGCQAGVEHERQRGECDNVTGVGVDIRRAGAAFRRALQELALYVNSHRVGRTHLTDETNVTDSSAGVSASTAAGRGQSGGNPSLQQQTATSDAISVTPSDADSVTPSDADSVTASDAVSVTPSDAVSVTASDAVSVTPSAAVSVTRSDVDSVTHSDADSVTSSDAAATISVIDAERGGDVDPVQVMLSVGSDLLSDDILSDARDGSSYSDDAVYDVRDGMRELSRDVRKYVQWLERVITHLEKPDHHDPRQLQLL